MALRRRRLDELLGVKLLAGRLDAESPPQACRSRGRNSRAKPNSLGWRLPQPPFPARREGVLIRRQVVVARVLLESSMSWQQHPSVPVSLGDPQARAQSGPMSSLRSSSSAVPLTPFCVRPLTAWLCLRIWSSVGAEVANSTLTNCSARRMQRVVPEAVRVRGVQGTGAGGRTEGGRSGYPRSPMPETAPAVHVANKLTVSASKRWKFRCAPGVGAAQREAGVPRRCRSRGGPSPVLDRARWWRDPGGLRPEGSAQDR